MNRPVLIIGGGPSGLSAAHALAAAGQRVVLVDKADRLGGARAGQREVGSIEAVVRE